jgi:LDH2 family malate/lactate/ureidoglycolate dehydrogenase
LVRGSAQVTLVKQATDRGFIAQISKSDLTGTRVASFGGCEALFTLNPMAMVCPGAQNPVLIDICGRPAI